MTIAGSVAGTSTWALPDAPLLDRTPGRPSPSPVVERAIVTLASVAHQPLIHDFARPRRSALKLSTRDIRAGTVEWQGD